jgi:hypothetical protein
VAVHDPRLLERRRIRRARDGDALPMPEGVGPSDLLLVRAREYSDLTAMLDALELPGSRAKSTPQADYAFRAVLTREEWTRYLSLEIDRIDYANFKARVQATQGSIRHDLYLPSMVGHAKPRAGGEHSQGRRRLRAVVTCGASPVGPWWSVRPEGFGALWTLG